MFWRFWCTPIRRINILKSPPFRQHMPQMPWVLQVFQYRRTVRRASLAVSASRQSCGAGYDSESHLCMESNWFPCAQRKANLPKKKRIIFRKVERKRCGGDPGKHTVCWPMKSFEDVAIVITEPILENKPCLCYNTPTVWKREEGEHRKYDDGLRRGCDTFCIAPGWLSPPGEEKRAYFHIFDRLCCCC